MIDAAALRVTISADSAPAERGLKSFSNKFNSAAKNMAVIGGVATGAITLPLVAMANSVFEVGVSFESAFAGVTKTVSGTATEMAALRDGIRAMAREMPSTVEEISAVAEAAGALGIAKENILGFTDVMIKLGQTTDMTSDQAATSLAQFANITGMAQTDFDRLGSAIVDLGNNGASTEAEIVNMALRIAGAGKQIGLSVPDILGWSSAMASMGISAEAGGTAISRVMVDVSKAVSKGGTELGKFADVAGVSNAAFSKMFKDAPSDAIISLVAGLNRIDAAGGNVFQTLEDLGFADVRVQDTMLRLMHGSDLLTDSVNMANEAWDKNTALTEEAAKRYATTESKLKTFHNKIRDVGITLFDVLAPAIGSVVDSMSGFASNIDTAIASLASLNPQVLVGVGVFLGLAAAIGPVLLVLSGLAAALASPLLPIALLVVGVVALGVAWATNVGGIQEVTAAAFAPVQEWFTSTLAGAKTLASGIATAFGKTKFPSIEALWKDFKAGDFETIASKITSTAYTLMVNLDTELNITGKANQLKQQLVGVVTGLGAAISDLDFSGATANANKMRDGILSSIAGAVDGIDFGAAGSIFAGLINKLKFAVSSLDFSAIDWKTVLQALFVGPAVAAVAGINWVVSSESFGKLKSSVQTAISTIPWGDITIATGGLRGAISRQISAVFADMGGDLGLKMPTMKMPTINIDWGKLTIDTLGLVNRVTYSINHINWTSVGTGVGTAIFNTVVAGVAGIGAAIKGLNWANDAITTFKLQVLGLGIRIGTEIGTALRGVNLFEASASLTASIQAALFKVFAGAVVQIRTSLGNLNLGGLLKLPDLKWPEFPKWEWPIFPIWSWPTYLPWIWPAYLAWTWPNYETWTWPAYLTFTWPSYEPWSWPAYASWIWPDYAEWTWPSIPMPSWVGSLLSFFAGGGGAPSSGGNPTGGQDNIPGIPAGANGFSNFRGGLALVGERGPEIVDLPRGSRVYSHQDSLAMAGGTTVNIYANVASDLDIESLANRVARVISRKQR